MELLDVIGSGNIHKCRNLPYEATVYSLQAEGVKLETFRANSKTELTLAVKATSDEEQQEKITSLKLPVNFSKDTTNCSHSSTGGN